MDLQKRFVAKNAMDAENQCHQIINHAKEVGELTGHFVPVDQYKSKYFPSTKARVVMVSSLFCEINT